MSLQNLSPEEQQKAKALMEGLRALSPQRLLSFRDQLKNIEDAESNSGWKRFARPDPITFGTEVLHLKPNAVQQELGLEWYTEDQGKLFKLVSKHRRVLALSGNGVGKSYSAAIISLWLYNKGYTVLTTAPTLDQVTKILWAEMRAMRVDAEKGLGGEWSPKANFASYSPKHFMQGFTVQTEMVSTVSTAFQGRHAEKIAVVLDEVIMMSAGVIEACDRICVGPEDIIIGIGNPTDTTSPIRKASEVEREDKSKLWVTLHISGENHPNVVYNRTVIPGAVSTEYISDQLAKAGSRAGSIYKASVLGQWPDETPDTLIRREWILAAQKRGEKVRRDDYRGIALGIDVSGEGGDLTPAFCVSNRKPFMPKLSSGKPWLQGRDTQQCVDLVHKILNEISDIRAIGIDDTGIGQGPRAQLQRERSRFPRFLTYRRSSFEEYNKERQATITGYNFSGATESVGGERFVRLKDQLWWTLREAFRNGDIDLPSDDEMRTWELPNGNNLIDQLSTAVYVQDGNGKIIVLDKRGAAGDRYKDKTKLLPNKSPDLAHALMIAWHVYNRLTPGQKPIEDTIELHQIERLVIKEKIKKRFKIHGRHGSLRKHPGRMLPWQRRDAA